MRWRELALICFSLTTWLGCSDDGDDKQVAHAGAANAAGQTGAIAGGGMGALGGASGSGVGGAAGTPVNAGGSSAVSGASGSAGADGIPTGWVCTYSAYGDGKCDCGCGVPDKDCTAADLAHCDVCNRSGGCNLAACPGRIDPDDTTKCLPPPPGWTCTPATYGDGKSCECGCGILDLDCPSTDVASCDNCEATGSCAKGRCPSSLSADDNTRCEIPPRWTCDPATYGDGTCHCGCGVVDVDCPDATDASCQVCDSSSCSPSGCAVEPDDNAHCPVPPETWKCSPRLYNDGTRCDCGCGAIDPDCASSGVDACDKCDAPGSCSAQPCPSFITPDENGHCDQPAAPADWTCTPAAYADGNTCDCGCGVADPDCRTNDANICARCLQCGGHGICTDLVDTLDPTQCAPPPSAWTCSADAFRDQVCDCGCGLLDSFCQDIELLYICGNYPVEGCSGGHRDHIDAAHNYQCIVSVPDDWTCDRSYYGDGLCDCGCGAVDLDCPSNEVGDCEKCDDDGSCETSACPGSIIADDTGHCSK